MSHYCFLDGESTAVGPQATSPDKEEVKPSPVKQATPVQKKPTPVNREPRKSSSKAKRNTPARDEKQSDSETERMHLPLIRPQTVTSGATSPYALSVRAETPKGKEIRERQSLMRGCSYQISEPFPLEDTF